MIARSILLFILFLTTAMLNAQQKPVRIGVAGLTHSHVHWIFGRGKIGDIEIVGISEPNRKLAEQYAKQYGFSMNMVYNSLEEMIAKTNPEAVSAFGSIFEHHQVARLAP